MLLNLIKEAANLAKYSENKKRTIRIIEQATDRKTAQRIVEAYQVTPDDYSKWLDVILGYAREEGVNIRNKTSFRDVAYAVLENDPAPIDFDMQDAIINTLWANFKAQQQHSKVQRVARAKEEEEQLNYALRKMKGQEECEFTPVTNIPGIEDEQESEFSQAYRAAFQDEEFDPEDEFDPRDRYLDAGDRDRGYRDEGHEETFGNDEDWWEDQDQQTEDEDADIIRHGKEFQHSRDLEDFDPSSEEGMARDEDTINQGSKLTQARDLEDFDQVSLPTRRKPQPRAYYAAEQEEVGRSYASPFTKGQLVTCKKDGASYRVEIPDGPGNQVGILVNNRIKMVPSKELETPHAKEEEETTSTQSSGRISFLHDVLTGENSREHLLTLQKKVEDEGANAWTRHHAKMPKNPHPTGSIAYKAWQRGMEKAAKDVWAPKPVLDPNKVKQKIKQRKK